MVESEVKNWRILAAAEAYLAIFLLTHTLAAQMPEIPAIGGGEAVIGAPADVESDAWVMSESPPWKVVGVQLTFNGDLPAGTQIFVEVYQNAGGTLNLVAHGSETLGSSLEQGNPVTIYFNEPQPASRLDKISVTAVANP